MSASRIILAFCHLSVNNYQNWWKFDEVLVKTILHSFLRHGVLTSYLDGCINAKGRHFHLFKTNVSSAVPYCIAVTMRQCTHAFSFVQISVKNILRPQAVSNVLSWVFRIAKCCLLSKFLHRRRRLHAACGRVCR